MISLAVRGLLAFLTVVFLSLGDYSTFREFSVWYSLIFAKAMLVFSIGKHGTENFIFQELEANYGFSAKLSIFFSFLRISLTLSIALLTLLSLSNVQISISHFLVTVALLVLQWFAFILRYYNRPIISIFFEPIAIPVYYILFSQLLIFKSSQLIALLKIELSLSILAVGLVVCLLSFFPNFLSSILRPYRTRNSIDIFFLSSQSLISIFSQWGLISVSGVYLSLGDVENLTFLLRLSALISFGQAAMNSYFAPFFSRESGIPVVLNIRLRTYRFIVISYVLVSILVLFLFFEVLDLGPREAYNENRSPFLMLLGFQLFNVALGPVVFFCNLFRLQHYVTLASLLSIAVFGVVVLFSVSIDVGVLLIASGLQIAAFAVFCSSLLWFFYRVNFFSPNPFPRC